MNGKIYHFAFVPFALLFQRRRGEMGGGKTRCCNVGGHN